MVNKEREEVNFWLFGTLGSLASFIVCVDFDVVYGDTAYDQMFIERIDRSICHACMHACKGDRQCNVYGLACQFDVIYFLF